MQRLTALRKRGGLQREDCIENGSFIPRPDPAQSQELLKRDFPPHGK